MAEGGIVTPSIAKTFERRHLYDIERRIEIGLVTTVADHRAGIGKKGIGTGIRSTGSVAGAGLR